jgi:Lon protease-like protein
MIMPMFPLGTVLLPGVVLPLHVFEPRYQQLVRDCLDATTHPEFGVVLIDRGSEVGGGDVRSDVGVVARILQVAAMDAGRFAIISVGTRRIKVTQWLPDDPYPRAEVEDWPDGDAQVSAERVATTATHARRCAGLAVATRRRTAFCSPRSARSDQPISTPCCARPILQRDSM